MSNQVLRKACPLLKSLKLRVPKGGSDIDGRWVKNGSFQRSNLWIKMRNPDPSTTFPRPSPWAMVMDELDFRCDTGIRHLTLHPPRTTLLVLLLHRQLRLASALLLLSTTTPLHSLSTTQTHAHTTHALFSPRRVRHSRLRRQTIRSLARCSDSPTLCVSSVRQPSSPSKRLALSSPHVLRSPPILRFSHFLPHSLGLTKTITAASTLASSPPTATSWPGSPASPRATTPTSGR